MNAMYYLISYFIIVNLNSEGELHSTTSTNIDYCIINVCRWAKCNASMLNVDSNCLWENSNYNL